MTESTSGEMSQMTWQKWFSRRKRLALDFCADVSILDQIFLTKGICYFSALHNRHNALRVHRRTIYINN